MESQTGTTQTTRIPWNKGKLVGQKHPLKLKDVWAIRIRLQVANKARELALFNLAIDSKLRGCDLVQLKVSDVVQGGRIASRAMVMQQKTHRPVQFDYVPQYIGLKAPCGTSGSRSTMPLKSPSKLKFDCRRPTV